MTRRGTLSALLLLGILGGALLLLLPPQLAMPLPLQRVVAGLLRLQAELHRELSLLVRALQGEEAGRAFLALMGVAFLYGVLHAAGPGHGKAVIAAYLVASRARLRRGVLLAFLSAAAQGVTAIVLVGGLGLLFGLQASSLRLEQASYLVIAGIGAWLLLRQLSGRGSACGHDHGPGRDHGPGHHDHDHHGHHHHGAACTASPPPPRIEEGPWWRLLPMAGAIGLRPCLGAVLVLLFAVGQGVFPAGVAAVVAMSAGTAITVATLALLTVVAREGALKLAGGSGRAGGLLARGFGVLGALLLLFLGLVLFLGTGESVAPRPLL